MAVLESHVASLTARELVDRLGPHPATALGFDASDPDQADRWFVLALLLSARGGEDAARAAYAALAGDGLATPRELAAAPFEAVARRLHAAGLARPETLTAVLLRASAALVERADGSPTRLAADADGLEELGGRLARLAPGVGRASVARFLRPLRGSIAAAGDLPLADGARAAAVCVGLLPDGIEGDAAAGALRAALAREPDAPPAADVEWALERLGARACRAGRGSRRCPLRGDCPSR
jgi:hypothetical protein